jgi:glycosyltransferase involved in cell wall biosynthesis
MTQSLAHSANSKHVLVLTTGPLPFDSINKVYAMALRGWLLARNLLEAGHAVTLVNIQILTGEPSSPYNQFEQTASRPLDVEKSPELAAWFGDCPVQKLLYYVIAHEKLIGTTLLDQICQRLKPDCIVSVGNYASFVGTSLTVPVPFWADLCGSNMAEGQAKAYTYNDNNYLEHFRQMELAVLKRADRFSAVSRAQMFALVGELGLLGRLNRQTYGHDLVSSVPVAFDPAPVKPAGNRVIVRGRLCPEDAFILLWSGGFNTWTDTETLFEGVKVAMERSSQLHMVVTGGGIVGHDEVSFPAFQARVNASPYRERFHFVGWVPTADLPVYYRESNLAILLDKWSYEGLLGSRSRILEWARYALPCVMTVTSELLQELNDAEALLTFDHESPDQLANLLVGLVEDATKRERLRQLGLRLQETAAGLYRSEKVYRPILNWVRNPLPAPDAMELNVNNQLATTAQLDEHLKNVFSGTAAESELVRLKVWAKQAQTELAARDFQINRLQKQLQRQKMEHEKLSDWSLSLEQQLLLHSASSKKKKGLF